MTRHTEKLTVAEIGDLEDLRIAVLIRTSTRSRTALAMHHSNSLLNRAATALESGDIETALALAEREFRFNIRIFGIEHPFTKSSKACIAALEIHLKLVSDTVSFIRVA